MASLKAEGFKDASETSDFEIPDGLSEAGRYFEARAAHDAGLVILAMGHPYWMFPVEGNFVICVKEEIWSAVNEELDVCGKLSTLNNQTAYSMPKEHDYSLLSFALYAVILVGFYVLQDKLPLIEHGRADSIAIISRGELWRGLTALTLHADFLHLVSNLLSGLGFMLLIARFFSAPVGWFLFIVSGFLGNLLNALVYYPEQHYSIGASTAIFGALGMITGIGLRAALGQSSWRQAIPRWFVPMIAGGTLLGLMGTGDEKVDVAAHISGYLCGMLLGFVGASSGRILERLLPYNFCFGSACFFVLGTAWALAFWG